MLCRSTDEPSKLPLVPGRTSRDHHAKSSKTELDEDDAFFGSG